MTASIQPAPTYFHASDNRGLALIKRGELERAGGRLYLAELLSNVTVTANAA
mgnify:CR=1 FL=1